jgi:Holliday junction resolvase
MAATPEAKVKAKVVKQLKELGAYYFSPVTGGYGRSGVPDIVVCINGRFVGIECKAGKGVTTALQEKNLEAIRQSGGKAFVLNEENVDSLTALLRIMGMLNEK